MKVTGRLEGRRALVTASSRFMGPAISSLFAEAGADVIADDRDLSGAGAVDALAAESGPVDILVANLAGVNPKTSVVETADSDWLAQFDDMVHPLMRLVRAFAPAMIERGRGKVVVIGSAAALRGMSNWSAYSAARGAQLAFVRAAGAELASRNVQVNAVAQSFVENPDYFPPEYQATDEFRARLATVPAARLASGREAALAALYLASEESDFLAGQVLPFAGGWVT